MQVERQNGAVGREEIKRDEQKLGKFVSLGFEPCN